MITLDSLHFLASMPGERLLEWLTAEDLSASNTLRLLTSLRKEYPAEYAGAALELARLRQKAADKFGENAQCMFFTREALEQASHPLVRQYRSRNPSLKDHRIIDVCCGIGSDSIAFAQVADDVLGIDIDPVRVEMARLNAADLSIHKTHFEVRDAYEPLPEADLIFFDPARRDQQGKRIFNVERYQPPLSLVKQWHTPAMVKLSPGIDLAQLEAYGGSVEFISVEGDLKEAVLHIPTSAAPRATLLLVNGSALEWQHGELSADVVLSAPRGWLIEPDPALIRAGLVTEAALQWDGTQLDETIAYIAADEQPQTPWARAWRVLDWMPFNLKKLRAYLRERNVGNVTVKKRGTAVTPETLIPQLKLKGQNSRTLVLTRCRGEQIAIICEDIGARNAEGRG